MLLFFLLGAGTAAAQAPLPALPVDSTHVYARAERMPSLPGHEGVPHGEYALIPLIHRALQLPAEVRAGRVEGQVVVRFVVGPSGVVKNAAIEQGLSPAVDAAVLRAVAQLPRLLPGRQDGRPVAVGLTVPVGVWGPQHVYTDREVGQPALFPTMGYADPGVAYRAYVRDHLRVPAAVAQQQLRGRVDVGFVVDATGRVRDARVVRSLCPGCDAEGLRLVRALPAWRPALDFRGQAVASRHVLRLELPPPPPETAYPDKVYAYAERMPELPGGGGSAALSAAIRQRVVGADACAGQVFVSFTVKADGTVGDAKIVKGLSAGCNAAVLAAVARLPRFTPGQQGGQAVGVGLTVPVRFPAASGK